MRWKLFVELCLTISIVFILAGDLFLPQPYRSGSQQLKSNINHFLIGLIPRTEVMNIQQKNDLFL